MFDDPDDLFSNDKARPNLYISPRNTTDYIQLRFQFARFRVYRIIRLPLTFTFANLHTLIQGFVVLHDDEELVTIKSCGRKCPLEDYEQNDSWAIDHWRRFEPANQPIYRVQPKVTRRKDKFDSVMTMEEKEVTLESIWSHNEANNVSDGQCPSSQIAIVYTYDLGDEWTVHVTCEQGNIFHRLDNPSNHHISGEYDAEEKTTRKTRLEILTRKEAEDRCREYLRRQKEKQDRIASGEQDEEDEEAEDDE